MKMGTLVQLDLKDSRERWVKSSLTQPTAKEKEEILVHPDPKERKGTQDDEDLEVIHRFGWMIVLFPHQLIRVKISTSSYLVILQEITCLQSSERNI